MNLGECLKTAAEPIRVAAEAKGLAFSYDIQDSSCVVNGDSDRLCQAIQNVLENAVKFTPVNGAVRVQLASVNSTAELTIHDTGVGISETFMPHAFDRFTQQDSSTTRSAGGLGLGLWIVRHIIELHGGSVDAANNNLGQGCVISMRIPLNR